MPEKAEENIRNNAVCFIDTEFNASDYSGQNDGFQEITEIGAVVFRNGRPVARFHRYCRIIRGHYLSRKGVKITGITWDVLKKKGIPFGRALGELQAFLEKQGVSEIYAFGTADRIELQNTAKLNGVDMSLLEMLDNIINVYPLFRKKLRLKETLSLEEICCSCRVRHGERAHSALCDAEDTGLAFFNMERGRIDRAALNRIKAQKRARGRPGNMNRKEDKNADKRHDKHDSGKNQGRT